MNSAIPCRIPCLVSNVMPDLSNISGLPCSLAIDTMIRTARTLTIEWTRVTESPFLETQ